MKTTATPQIYRKNVIVLIVLLSFVSTRGRAQSISETNKYLTFMKTCNFLKYYHPQFTHGKINADSFFLAKQAKLDGLTTVQDFNQFLIHTLKAIKVDQTNELRLTAKAAIKENPLNKWYLKDPALNNELKAALLKVYANRDTSGKYHVPKINYETEIPNEIVYPYADTVNIPAPMRMLTLAKLQGVISYLNPHQSLMPENWDTMIRKNIPLFKNCGSRKDYEILLLKIVASFKDTHSYRFYTGLKYKAEIFKNTFYPPFDYQVLNDRILITNIIIPEICERAGIKAGSLITRINHETITERINSLENLLSASNRNTLIYKLNEYITNFIWSATSPAIELEIMETGKSKNVQVDFVKLTDKPNLLKINAYLSAKGAPENLKQPFEILNTNIAYFNIGKSVDFLNGVPEQHLDQKMDSILNLAAKQKGIIFDMRGYPWGGLVHHYIYKKFSKPDNRYAAYFKADLKNLGTFTPIQSASTYYPDGVKTENVTFKGKVIIIVSAATQSRSEWNAMNLQHVFSNAETIGTQTAGADGDEKSLNIPGNYELSFTGNAIFYPDGTPAQGKGVKIDKVVKPKVADILNGKDTMLQLAINKIEKTK